MLSLLDQGGATPLYQALGRTLHTHTHTHTLSISLSLTHSHMYVHTQKYTQLTHTYYNHQQCHQ